MTICNNGLRSGFLVLLIAGSAGMWNPIGLSGQVTRQRGESYDAYYTRKVQEETANFRNNNPNFGVRPSSGSGTFSSLEEWVRRDQARRAAARNFDPAAAAEERAAAERARIAEEAERAARKRLSDQWAEQRRIEAARAAEAAGRQRWQEHRVWLELAERGSRTAAFELGRAFDRNALPPGLELAPEQRLESALLHYRAAAETRSWDARLRLFGLYPRLLAPAKYRETAGAWIDRSAAALNPQAAFNSLVAADRNGDLAATLVLAAWHQRRDLGFGRLSVTDSHTALTECLRLYGKVGVEFPRLGAYFAGSLAQGYTVPGSCLTNLQSLARNHEPMAGDPTGMLGADLQTHARILMAELILERRVQGTPEEAAFLLRQGDSPAPAALIRLGDWVFHETAGHWLSRWEGIRAYEALPDRPEYVWYRGRAQTLRGLALLEGDGENGQTGKPDPAAAARYFEQAEGLFRGTAAPPARVNYEDQKSHPDLGRQDDELDIEEVSALRWGTLLRYQLIDPAKVDTVKGALTPSAAGPIGTQLLRAASLATGSRGFQSDADAALRHFGNLAPYRGPVRPTIAAEAVEALVELARKQPGLTATVNDQLQAIVTRANGCANLPLATQIAAGFRGSVSTLATHRELIRLQGEARGPGVSEFQTVEHAVRLGIAGSALGGLSTAINLQLDRLPKTALTRAWRDAFGRGGPERTKAIGALPATGLTAELLKVMEAHSRVTESRDIPEQLRSMTDLCALAESGSLDAYAILMRNDYPGFFINTTAHRWTDPILRRLAFAACARFEAGKAAQSRVRSEQAQGLWLAALENGHFEARRALAGLGVSPEEVARAVPEAIDQSLLKKLSDIESFLLELPGLWWTTNHLNQFDQAFQSLATSARPELAAAYADLEAVALPREVMGGRKSQDPGRAASARVLYAQARCRLDGLGRPADLLEASRLHRRAEATNYNLSTALSRKLSADIEKALTKQATAQSEPAWLEEMLRLHPRHAAAMPPDVLDTVFARVRAALDAEPVPDLLKITREAACRTNVTVMAALVFGRHLPAYAELSRRAAAGETDAAFALAAVLHQLSLANVPRIRELVKQSDRLFFSGQWLPNNGWKDEGLFFQIYKGEEVARVLADAAGQQLTVAQPFFVDPPPGEGEPWPERLVRTAALKDTALQEKLLELTMQTRLARGDRLHEEPSTPAEELLVMQHRWRNMGSIAPEMLEAIRARGDSVDCVLALRREFNLETPVLLARARADIPELKKKLLAIDPDTSDPLLAACRAVGVRTEVP